MDLAYIKIFKDVSATIDLLSDNEAGRLFKAVLRYANGVDVNLPGQERLVFAMLKSQIDRDKAEYNCYLEKQRENGSKGGRPKKTQQNPKNPTDFLKTQKSQDKDKDKDKDKDEYIDVPNGTLSVSAVVDAWNLLPDVIPKVVSMRKNSKREQMLLTRIRENSLESVLAAIDNIRQSEFLQGNNDRRWIITFDWFVRPENFPKVLEGNYADRNTKKSDSDRVKDALMEWMEA